MSAVEVDLDVCPSCGVFAVLDAYDGWCAKCLSETDSVPANICITCKQTFVPDSATRKMCSSCRGSEWLTKNGDALERLIAQGVSLASAIILVAASNRPVCLSCGTPINNGTKGKVFFCHRTPECRKAVRRLRYYKEIKGLNAHDALEKVKESLK